MKRNSGLGRGLDALFAPVSEEERPLVTELSMDLIDPQPAQPRKNFDADKLEELKQSILRHGLIQPVLVCPEQDRYRIVAGERRYRAARLAGLRVIPVVVREMDDEKQKEIALIENLQREDLNPIEQAEGIFALMQAHNMTQDEAAERLGKSRPAVANTLRLLNLHPDVRQLLRGGRLSAGHARALIPLDPARQIELARMVIEKDLSVRRLEQLLKPPAKRINREAMDEAERAHLQDTLRESLGTKVRLEGGYRKGTITIEYFAREDLERIYALLTGGQG